MTPHQQLAMAFAISAIPLVLFLVAIRRNPEKTPEGDSVCKDCLHRGTNPYCYGLGHASRWTPPKVTQCDFKLTKR